MQPDEEPTVIVEENEDGTTTVELEAPTIDPTLAVNAALT
jgi:hypothetical protein